MRNAHQSQLSCVSALTMLDTKELLAGFCPHDESVSTLCILDNEWNCPPNNCHYTKLWLERYLWCFKQDLLLAGYCPHGVKCQHAHSAEELRVSVLIQSDVLDEEYHIEFCQSLVRGGTCAIGAALFLLVLQQCACDKGFSTLSVSALTADWQACKVVWGSFGAHPVAKGCFAKPLPWILKLHHFLSGRH